MRHRLHLADDRGVAPGRHHTPLMKSECAEITAAEAAPVVNDRKPNLFDCRNAAQRIIHRVRLARVGKSGDAVEFFSGKRHLRRVNDETAPLAALTERPAAHGVVLLIFNARRIGVGALVAFNRLKGRQRQFFFKGAKPVVRRKKSRSAHVANCGGLYFPLEPLRNFACRRFAHAVDK